MINEDKMSSPTPGYRDSRFNPFTKASGSEPANQHRRAPDDEDLWPTLVERIQAGDPDAMSELYRLFGRGIRFLLCRRGGPQDLDDRMHDTFLIAFQAIRRGELREPSRLIGFVRTIARRSAANEIRRTIKVRKEYLDFDCQFLPDTRANPEKDLMLREQGDLLRLALDTLCVRDREILRRFYVEEEHPDRICEEMKLSVTQFRLLKSRAKARFVEVGRSLQVAGRGVSRIAASA
jgi:RNA polymerase sigma factor (sigma-70 family)